jgi:hypothetical protein
MGPKSRIGQHFDRMALIAINRRIPNNGARRFECPYTLEDALAETLVNESEAPSDRLTSPGEHTIRLESKMGGITCRITVRPASRPDAPLFLYHHGLAEYPYTASWRRLFPKDEESPAHLVAVQAPYHSNMVDPVRVGFSSTAHLYQMLAGSLRIMQVVSDQFARQGAGFTIAGGLSWGGITSLLYEGLFNNTRAVIPMFASPLLSQVIWDASQLVGRPLPVSRQELDRLFDFTPIYERVDPRRVFPVLGEHDLFFRLENHAAVYPEESLVTLPSTHVGATFLRKDALREHALKALAWAESHPR